MNNKYHITPIVWALKDEASVKFHVKNNDYFGTLAAILNLIKQQIKKDDVAHDVIFSKIYDNLEKDLLFLQKNYQIKLSNKKKNKRPKGKLINQ